MLVFVAPVLLGDRQPPPVLRHNEAPVKAAAANDPVLVNPGGGDPNGGLREPPAPIPNEDERGEAHHRWFDTGLRDTCSKNRGFDAGLFGRYSETGVKGRRVTPHLVRQLIRLGTPPPLPVSKVDG